MSNRARGFQSQPFHPYRKGTQRSLAANLQLADVEAEAQHFGLALQNFDRELDALVNELGANRCRGGCFGAIENRGWWQRWVSVNHNGPRAIRVNQSGDGGRVGFVLSRRSGNHPPGHA